MRWLWGIAAVLWLTACGGAPAPSAGPALWLARDADSRVWLFGTVHVLPKTVTWRTPKIEAALQQADVLILEVAPETSADPAFARAFDEAGRNPQGVTLSSLLSADDRARLQAASAKAGLDPASLEVYRPWMAALRLSYGALARRGVTAAAGVETVLTEWARSRGLKVEGLESGADQIGFFQRFSKATELAAFRQTLNDIDNGAATLERIDRLWANGRAQALGDSLLPEFKTVSAEFYDILIKERNQRWADLIVARLAGQGDVFVAVGAAHMAGPDGLPALLRARGIAVEGP